MGEIPVVSGTTWAHFNTDINISVKFVATGSPAARAAGRGIHALRPGGSAGAAGPGTSAILLAQAEKGGGRIRRGDETAGEPGLSTPQTPRDLSRHQQETELALPLGGVILAWKREG